MVTYEYPSSNPTATGCQIGTRRLGSAIKQHWPQLQVMEGPYGCFNRRRIAGSHRWSTHAEGRALDLGVPASERGDDGVGWEAFCKLVLRWGHLGIQQVQWSRHIWTLRDAQPKLRKQIGGEEHLDHIHLEQRWAFARNDGMSVDDWRSWLEL